MSREFKSNVPFEGVRKFNEGFYTVDLRVVILSDNDPLEWDYLTLLEEINKQYKACNYALSVEAIE